MNNFGPNSTNPREIRAYAHAKIKQFKDGDASYSEAFEAAHAASGGSKGERSHFGRLLGGVVVDAYVQNFDNDTVVVSGLSLPKQQEVADKEAGGRPYSYSPDAYMVRPDAHNTPVLKGVIEDPIVEGFAPLPRR